MVTDRQVVPYGIISAEERLKIFGIDCVGRLEWRGWQPGGEYVRNLVVRNISTKALKLRYKLPSTKYFSMDFPDAIKLSAGMSYPIKIVFRPIREEEYHDTVEIIVNGASFLVEIGAFLPHIELKLPERIDFGFRPAKEEARIPFVVTNTGAVNVAFEWHSSAPFSVEPVRARLDAGCCAEFAAVFVPTDASVYTGSAQCLLDNGSSCTLRLEGVGKFPFLALDCTRIDFGEVIVGKVATQFLRLTNHSSVVARYTVDYDRCASGGVFALSPTRGAIPPSQHVLMKLTYQPKFSTTFNSEAASISTPGGNTVQLVFQGTAAGPSLSLSAKSFNFGTIQLGKATSRVLYLENHSDTPLMWAVQAEQRSSFSLDVDRGILRPKGQGHVTISFAPERPVVFWKRISLLVKDSEPQWLDLIGVGASDKVRPPPLHQRHIDAALLRAASGSCGEAVPPAPPSPTHASTQHGPPRTDAAAAVASRALSDTGSYPAAAGWPSQAQPSPPASQLQPSLPWQTHFDGSDPANAVVLDTCEVDFGSVSRMRAGDFKVVHVHNRCGRKISAHVDVPMWVDPGGLLPPQRVFQAFPESQDIASGCTGAFRVTFRPPADRLYICQTLEVLAFAKHMRNFRLVTPENLMPPWTLPVTASGNSYLHLPQLELPKVSLMPNKAIIFPACRAGHDSFQTLALANDSDTPVDFFIDATLMKAQHFSVKPCRGVVPPNSFALAAFRFSPKQVRRHSGCATVVINNNSANAWRIELTGLVQEPALRLDLGPGGVLRFSPTCVGASAVRRVVLHNPSRIPVSFQWLLPQRMQRILEVSPEVGILRGNDTAEALVLFTPREQKTYTCRAALQVRASSSGGSAGWSSGVVIVATPAPVKDEGAEEEEYAAQVSVPVVAEGTHGAVLMDPPELDCGDVTVGLPVRRTVAILNQSNGPLQYTLEMSQDDQPFAMVDRAPVGFELGPFSPMASLVTPGPDLCCDEPEGFLPARACKKVQLVFQPKQPGRSSLSISCRTRSAPPPATGDADGRVVDASCEADNARQVHAVLTANVAFPQLLISDVRRAGVGKDVLWEMLSVRRVNSELGSCLSELELKVQADQDQGRQPVAAAVTIMPPVPFRFGKCATGADPVTVHLQLHNPGALPADWVLISEGSEASDGDVELENWGALLKAMESVSSVQVMPAMPRNEREKLRDFILDNRIFQVHPTSGMLQSGESAHVTVTFSPIAQGPTWLVRGRSGTTAMDLQGTYELAVMLHVRNGKRVRFQLSGQAVPAATQQLVLRSPIQMLHPAPIGDQNPPMQVTMLYNGGPAPLEWAVDTAAVEQLQHDNHGYPVMRFLGPLAGTIPAGSAQGVNLVFNPVEAKQYRLTLPVEVGGDSAAGTAQLEFQGRGFHPDEEGAGQLRPDEAAELDPVLWRGFHKQPSLQLDTALAHCSHDYLSFGTTLIRGAASRLLLLRSHSPSPIAFTWNLASFARDHGMLDGELKVEPAEGVLEPHQHAVIWLSFRAGLNTQIFRGLLQCRLAPQAKPVKMTMGGLMGCIQDTKEGKDAERVVQEVVAQHPPKLRGPATRSPGKAEPQRLPLHQAMTHSVRQAMPLLDEQYQSTLRKNAAREGARKSIAQVQSEPQTLTLFVTGRVLSKHHLAEGQYALPSEEEERAVLQAGGAWIPPRIDGGVSRAPPPAPSAAAQPEENQNAQCGEAVAADGMRPPAAGVMEAARVLEELLLDVVCDVEVSEALQEIEDALQPEFRQIAAAVGAAAPPPAVVNDADATAQVRCGEDADAQGGQEDEQPEDTAEVAPVSTVAPADQSEGLGAEEVEAGTEAAAAGGDSNNTNPQLPCSGVLGDSAVVPETDAQPPPVEGAEDGDVTDSDRIRTWIRTPETALLTEMVLSSAIRALILESADDDWELACT